jgi:hypothetical protein
VLLQAKKELKLGFEMDSEDTFFQYTTVIIPLFLFDFSRQT